MARDLITRLTVDSRSFVREMNRAEGAANKFGTRTTTSVRRASGETEKANRRMGDSFGSIAKRAAVGAAAIGGAYAGVAKAKDAISATENLAKATIGLSRNFGFTEKRASEFAAVAQVRNVTYQQLSQSFTTLAKQTAAAGKGTKGASDAFKALGITTADVKRGQSDFPFIINKVAEGLGKMEGGSKRAALAQQLLGRQARTLLPLFRGGSQGLQEQLNVANKYGATLSGKPLRSMEDFVKASREMEFANLGLKISFTEAVAPTLVKMTKSFGAFTQELQKGNQEKAFDVLFTSISDNIKKATPVLAKNAGKLGGAVAIGLVKGFIDADPFSKAVILGLVAKRLGLFALAGRRAGAAFSAGMAETEGAGIAAGAAGGRAGMAGGAVAAGVQRGATARRIQAEAVAADNAALLGAGSIGARSGAPVSALGARGGLAAGALAARSRLALTAGRVAGPAAIVATLVAGPEFLKAIRQPSSPRETGGSGASNVRAALDTRGPTANQPGRGLLAEAEQAARRGDFSKLNKQIDGAREALRKWPKDAAGPSAILRRIAQDIPKIKLGNTIRDLRGVGIAVSGAFNRQRAQDIISNFKGLENVGSLSMKKLNTAVTAGFKQIKFTFRNDPKAARQAMQAELNAAATGVAKSMDKSKDAAAKGWGQIKSLMKRDVGASRDTVLKGFPAIATAINKAMDKGVLTSGQGMRQILSLIRRNTGGARTTVDKNFRAIADTIAEQVKKGRISTQQGMDAINSAVDKQLTAFGLPKTRRPATGGTGQGGQSGGRAQKARGGRVSRRDMGGWIGERGMAEGDNTPIWVGGGEAVVNRHQQPYVEQAMGFAKQMGVVPYGNLDELYQNETRPHYAFAQGGKVPASETSGRSSRSSTTWPSIRNIANKFGLTITSTYRTPSRNAAVGGVPGSWHTAGSPANPGAADFVPPSPAARAYAPSVGGKQILIHNAGSGLHLHVGFFPPGGKFGGANVSGGSGGGAGASAASAGVGFSATPLKRFMVRGDLGKISTVAQRGVDKVREQADKFLEKKAASAGAGGSVSTGATSNSMMGIARIILNVGTKFGADPKRMLAAMEAGLVESNLSNISGGDRDSVGVFQQRPSQGWGSVAQIMNVTYAAGKFFDSARGAGGATAGDLAANVQRPAAQYRGRYGQRRGQAIGILRRLGYKASFAGFAKGGRVAGRQLALSPADLAALRRQEAQARLLGIKVRDDHGPEDHARGGRVRRFAPGGKTGHGGGQKATGKFPSWKSMVATWFSDGTGYKGDSLAGKQGYAELGMGSRMGGLPYRYPLDIRFRGKTVSNAPKLDIGAGAPGAKIDLDNTTAGALRFKSAGKAAVQVRDSGSATPVAGSKQAKDEAAAGKPAALTGLDLKQQRLPLVDTAFSTGYGVGQTGRRLGGTQLDELYQALYADDATAAGSTPASGKGGTKPAKPTSKGYAAYTFPLPSFASQGRTDRGQDMEAKSGYATTVALGAGQVVGTGIGFLGMQLKLADGPQRGKTVFYGHNSKIKKRMGARVQKGAALGATGGPPGGSPTHTEIGFEPFPYTGASWSGRGSAGGRLMNHVLNKIKPQWISRRDMARGGFAGGRRSAPRRFQTGGFVPRADPFGYSTPKSTKPAATKPLGVGKPAKKAKPGLLGGLLAAGNLDTYINKYLKATDEKLAQTVLGKVGTALDALGDSFDKAVRQRLTRLQKAIDKIEQKDKFSAADLKLLGQYSNLQTTIGRIGPRPPVGGVDFAAKVGGIVTDPDSAAVGLKLAGKLDAYVKRFRGEKDETKAKDLLSKIQQYLGEVDLVSLAAIDGRYKRLTKEIKRLQKDGVTADEAKTIKTIQGLLTVYSEEAGRRIGLFVKDANEKLTAATDTEGSAIGRVLRRQGIDESSVAGLQALQYAGSNDPNAIRATITKLTAAQKEATRYGDTTTADDLKAQIADLTDKLDEAITVQIERGRQIMTQVATENLGKVTEFTDNIELQRRAKLISDKTAASETLSVREQALLGKFGPIAPKDRLEILAAIRDNTDATQSNNDALNAVRDEISKTNANAAAMSSTELGAAFKALADMMNGQIVGRGIVNRGRTGGSGRVTTY